MPSTEVSRQTAAARACGPLPSAQKLSGLSLLAQAGDYALYIARRLSTATPDEQELKTFDKIGEYISVFTAEILQMGATFKQHTLDGLVYDTDKSQQLAAKTPPSIADSLGKMRIGRELLVAV